ncbi:hypothetical protein SASPL_110738 [Salvia splendens]|uniref:Uncharacterized protein n=1 Tax=Salvia splendens TaxID=180675 RepID=A0A8X8Y7R6_SALSN|nr:hypothetical protein SASPL_110738 [Salvia splendens]
MLPAGEMTWESSSPSTINFGAKPTNMESLGDLAQIGFFPLGFLLARARQRQDIGLPAPHPRERTPSPPQIILGRRAGDEFEAGPSRPPVEEPQTTFASTTHLQPLPVLEDHDPGELTIAGVVPGGSQATAIYIDSSSEEDP